MPDSSERERAQLLEIARLYAALIHVVAAVDDPVLKSELADLIWPRHTQEVPLPMPAPVIVVDPGPLSQRRKLMAAILSAALVFFAAVNVPGGGEVGAAIVTTLPLIVGAIVVYFTENKPEVPSSKFLVSLGASFVTLVVFMIQHGIDEWRSAFLTAATGVVGAVILWLTPNAGQAFIDAADPA